MRLSIHITYEVFSQTSQGGFCALYQNIWMLNCRNTIILIKSHVLRVVLTVKVHDRSPCRALSIYGRGYGDDNINKPCMT